MLKTVLILSIVATAAPAQQAIYSNASANPAAPALAEAAISVNGAPAPVGGLWSEVAAPSLAESNALAGIACHADSAGGVRIADNFIVPEGQSWNLEQLWVYAYQPDLAGSSLPIASATARIWYGNPAAGGQVVWGDSTTNRLVNATATNTYRIFTTEVGPIIDDPGMSRRIFRVALSTPAALTAGEYWIDWQLTPSTPSGWFFAVPATVTDARTQPGWNAQTFVDGAWSTIADQGKPITAPDVAADITFILAGTTGSACDTIDFNGDTILPDITDVADFITVFGGGSCSTGTCGDIDFNNDGLFPDTQDITSLLSVFSGGPCL